MNAASDLPNIGAPALRALEADGITTVAELRARGVEGLRDLHGLGPKALRLLTESLRDDLGPDSGDVHP